MAPSHPGDTAAAEDESPRDARVISSLVNLLSCAPLGHQRKSTHCPSHQQPVTVHVNELEIIYPRVILLLKGASPWSFAHCVVHVLATYSRPLSHMLAWETGPSTLNP